MLGTFGVRLGGVEAHSVPVGSQRLIAYLALHDRAVARTTISATMWPEVTDGRSDDSLRSALTRLDPPLREAVVVSSAGLRLADSVTVDYREAQTLARRLLHSGESPLPEDLSLTAVRLLSAELLPDWYDEWVAGKAEDWRQLRVSALEAQARVLTEAGELASAAEAARAAIEVEPLRETGHAALIRIHLAGGNQSEAIRAYDHYRTLLHRELGIGPTPLISKLVSTIRDKRRGK